MSNSVATQHRNFDTQYKWWEDLEKTTKLDQAFAIGCSDKEACGYAEITEAQLYYYQKEINPEFVVKKEELKDKPILKAKQTVVRDLDKVESAKWYLEKKKKDEFGNVQEIKSINLNVETVLDNSKSKEIAEKYEQELLNTLQDES